MDAMGTWASEEDGDLGRIGKEKGPVGEDESKRWSHSG